MAKMTAMEALESKIEKAQQQVSKTKKQYDAATAKLSDLLDKRDALKRDELVKAIKTNLRTKASPRHVPALIYAAPDLPKTLNGKKVESAVTNIVNGRKVTNRDALSNPESLDFFESMLPELTK